MPGLYKGFVGFLGYFRVSVMKDTLGYVRILPGDFTVTEESNG